MELSYTKNEGGACNPGMRSTSRPATRTVTAFTRHSLNCAKKADRYWKRRGCMKWLYIKAKGRDRSISAKTRSWKQGEVAAQAERDHHDPVQEKLREIQVAEKLAAEKRADQKAQNITVSDALAHWAAGLKGRKE